MSGRAIINLSVVAMLLSLCGAMLWLGYRAGQDNVRSTTLAEKNAQLIEAHETTALLTAQVKRKQDDYIAAKELISAHEAAANTDAARAAYRVRLEARAAAIARATADSLRDYATQAERDIEWTEAERSRFGVQAAEAAAAAHALKSEPITRRSIDEYRKSLR